MKEFFKKALPYLITSVIGVIIFIVIICTKTIWNANGTQEIMHILSDAFFVPGVLLAGVGLIIFASNGGAFDIFGYAVISIFDRFRKDVKNKKYKDYYEYREAKKEKKRSMGFMLIVGIAFIAMAVIFLIIYYQY